MAQQIQLGQQQPISADILQLATTHNIGTPLAEHKARLLGKGLFAAFVLTAGAVFLIITIIGLFHRYALGSEIVLLLCSFALISYGLLRALRVLSNLDARVYRCTDGLMRVQAGKVEVIRWEQIAEICKTFRVNWLLWIPFLILALVTKDANYNLYRPSYSLNEYVLRRPDGTELRLYNAFQQFKALQTVLEQEVTRRLLPGAIATYNAGTPINFGQISVNTLGISVRNGRKTLPWNELGRVDVDVYKGFIIIRKGGKFLKRQWASTRSSKVPNACVLEALVNYVTSGQQRQVRS